MEDHEEHRINTLRQLMVASVIISVMGLLGASGMALSIFGRGERDVRLEQEQIRIALIQRQNQDDIAIVKTQVAAALTAATAASGAVLNLTTVLLSKAGENVSTGKRKND